MPESRIDTTLRDDLAAERTVLANERTLLAYIRTAVALALTGVSAMHLPGLYPDEMLSDSLYYVAGAVLMALAAAVVVVGYRRYRRVKSRIAATPAHPLTPLDEES